MSHAVLGPRIRVVNTRDSARFRLKTNILQDVLAAVVLCIGTAQGTLNAMGWGLAAVFAGMTVLNALALRSLPGEPHSDAP